MDELDEQQELVESSLDLVFETYDVAVADKIKQPVVMLVDCEDELGSQFARAWIGDEAVDNAIAHEHLEGDAETTVFARPVTWSDARQELPAAFPYLAPLFQEPYPNDGVLVIAIACGGACALTAPWDARPTGDS